MERKQPLILKVRQGRPDVHSAVRQAADALGRGSLVIVPTDTVYGVAADALAGDWAEKLYTAKGRDRGKPVPLLAADTGQVEHYGGKFEGVERVLAERFWPGPLTLVLRVRNGAEGFRVPACEITLELLRAVGHVLRVTSANVSGGNPALTVEDAVAALGAHVEMALDAGHSPGGIVSTVARVENGKIVVLRQGAISREALMEAAGQG